MLTTQKASKSFVRQIENYCIHYVVYINLNINMKFIACLLFTFMSIAAVAQSQQIEETIKVNGIKRDFTTYLPNGGVDGMPVIISLHGGFASPEGQFKLAEF
jgi:poly(3-hydroxybutyrate) depolymerase